MTPTASRATARPSTAGRAIAARSASRPIWTKNTGINTLATAPNSRSTRACWSLRPIANPATKAPMIGASLAHSAAQEKARTKAKATTTIVADDRDHRSTSRKPPGTTSDADGGGDDEEADGGGRPCR